MKLAIILITIFLTTDAMGQDTLNTTLPTSKAEWAKQDIFLRKNIAGKWKDQNSTIIFYREKFSVIFDDKDKDKQTGDYQIKNSKIILYLHPNDYVIAYQILYFSPTEMKFIDDTRNDPTIWVAKKVGRFNDQ